MKHQNIEEKQFEFKWLLAGDFMLWDLLMKVLVQMKDSLIQWDNGKNCWKKMEQSTCC